MENHSNFYSPNSEGGGRSNWQQAKTLQPRLANKRLAMPIRHLFVLLLLLPLFWGCDKEPLLDNPSEAKSTTLDFRENLYTGLDTTAVLDLVGDITGFKAQLDDWRAGNRLDAVGRRGGNNELFFPQPKAFSGRIAALRAPKKAQGVGEIAILPPRGSRRIKSNNLTETVEAEEAASMMEMVANFYLSRPAKAFAEYHFLRDSVPLAGLPAIWSGAQAATVFTAVKQRLNTHFNALSGSDKGFQFLDFGISDRSGSPYLYMAGQIGRTEISEPQETVAGDIRWARGNAGFDTTVTCPPGADVEIGRAVNSQLGFFLQNLPPSPINCCNPLLRPNTLIIGPIERAETNFLGIPFFLAGAQPSLILESTFRNPGIYQNDIVNLGNTPPDFPIKGQYMIHGDFIQIEQGNEIPDEHCFSFTKFANYITSNRAVGDMYIPRVNQENGSIFPYTLISTFVGNFSAGTELDPPPEGPGIIKFQEHPTYHFYAFLLQFQIPDPDLVSL